MAMAAMGFRERLEERRGRLAAKMGRLERELDAIDRKLERVAWEVTQEDERRWARGRIAALAREGLGAGEIADRLREERGYAMTAAAVAKRVERLRRGRN